MPPKKATGEYIETDTGNRVSRRSAILGTQNIILGGKTTIHADVLLRGDLCRPAQQSSSSSGQSSSKTPIAIAIGRYCILSPACTLKPPSKLYKGVYSYYPLKIGDHVSVGEGSVVEAAVIGNYVQIGKGCVIGRFAIIKDCVRILEGAVVAPGMVIESWSVVGGRPAKVVGKVEEGELETLDLRAEYRAAIGAA
jgi:dynactin-5